MDLEKLKKAATKPENISEDSVERIVSVKRELLNKACSYINRINQSDLDDQFAWFIEKQVEKYNHNFDEERIFIDCVALPIAKYDESGNINIDLFFEARAMGESSLILFEVVGNTGSGTIDNIEDIPFRLSTRPEFTSNITVNQNIIYGLFDPNADFVKMKEAITNCFNNYGLKLISVDVDSVDKAVRMNITQNCSYTKDAFFCRIIAKNPVLPTII